MWKLSHSYLSSSIYLVGMGADRKLRILLHLVSLSKVVKFSSHQRAGAIGAERLGDALDTTVS